LKVNIRGNVMLRRQAAFVIAFCSMFLSATTMATDEAEYTALLKEDNTADLGTDISLANRSLLVTRGSDSNIRIS
jgi:hypothetical protein